VGCAAPSSAPTIASWHDVPQAGGAAVASIAGTVNSGGNWLVGTNGAAYPLGNAVTHGSPAGTHLNAPVDAVATTAHGGGYSLVAKDGGLFAYGDSGFYGSGTGQFSGTTVVGIAPSDQC